MTILTSKLPYQDTFDEMEPRSGFDMRVLCCRNIPPRDPMFEYISELGRGQVERLFLDRDNPVRIQPSEEHIYLVFPENYLSIHEQRWLSTALEAAGFKRADVITSSVFLVQASAALSVLQDPKYLEDREASNWWFYSALENERKNR